ncbi:uncharacterized protein LOC118761365, partial [Octopus sinensis]|uniref:Uncharacterized protein LOC118761365 n=1 Tax=Octopus sinensis TaxID=2607531 RepID=A0A7E6EHM3_9MOLL
MASQTIDDGKNPTPISYTVIIVFVVLFPLLFILGCFLPWIIMKTRKYKRGPSIILEEADSRPVSNEENGQLLDRSEYVLVPYEETGETPKLSIYNMMQNK